MAKLMMYSVGLNCPLTPWPFLTTEKSVPSTRLWTALDEVNKTHVADYQALAPLCWWRHVNVFFFDITPPAPFYPVISAFLSGYSAFCNDDGGVFSCFLRRSRLAADPKFISGFYPVILRIIRKLELKRENRAKKRGVAVLLSQLLDFQLVPGTGLEPVHLSAADFKSAASAIPPSGHDHCSIR